MYICINMAQMRVLYKHPSLAVVLKLVHIEVPAHECKVAEIDIALHHFTEYELRILYRKLFEKDAPSDVREVLFRYLIDFPVTDVIPWEVDRLACTIGDKDCKTYKYVKGMFNSSAPIDLFEPKKEIGPGSKGYMPEVKPYTPGPNAVYLTDEEREQLRRNKPEESSTPRPLRPAGSNERPRKGSATGKVWDIADEISKTTTDEKSLRKAVIAKCVEEGINQSTASVQFGKWKNAKN